MIDKIRNDQQYRQVMAIIEGLIAKAISGGGFNSLSEKENKELNTLSLLAESYEDNVLKIMPLPVTIEGVVAVKMEEMNMNQNKLAELLGLGTSKLSQILNGKRKPDIPFLKAVHQKLGIDGNFILEKI